MIPEYRESFIIMYHDQYELSCYAPFASIAL